MAFAANGDDMFQIDAIVLEAHGQFVVKMHRDFKFSAAQENLFFLQPVERYGLCETFKLFFRLDGLVQKSFEMNFINVFPYIFS